VETGQGFDVTAESIVVATNVPFNNRVAIHTKQAPYTTYVVGLEVPSGLVVPALYWDTRQSSEEESSGAAPYHYVRLVDGDPAAPSDLLIVGGEDHKSGQAHDEEQRFASLEAWARERWPGAGAVKHRWSGQVMEPQDGMAFIGRNPLDKDNVYVATGDSGNGMTHGTIAGILISDLILGHPNDWEKLYDPGRVRAHSVSDFIRENANVVAQYGKGYLGPSQQESDIAPGEGAIVRHGAKRIAAYREMKSGDSPGELHEMSAVCPHLGCVVSWNKTEKTWDCPCHGSRFAATGEVINGPANRALSPIRTESGAT
jgi:nitrite reductase/ring-hydroxylating ferredoxin subunit